MPSNIDAARKFQEASRRTLQQWFGRPFDMRVEVALPDGRSHHFDLVTAERDVFVECRLVNWQPGAGRLREAIDFLKSLPGNPARYLVVPAEKHADRNETFAQFFIRSNESRIGGVNVLELDPSEGKLTCVHGSLPASADVLPTDEVGAYCKQLDRILDWVEEFRNREDSRADRVNRLRSEGKIPKSVALQMHSLLQSEAQGGGGPDALAVRAAWTAVVDWARTEGCRATELTTPA